MIIKVNITDKVARAEKHEPLVCGNSDYIIEFAFDEEWNEYQTKTARFKFNDQSYIDVVFTGTRCPVPLLNNTNEVIVGVFAGDLKTTTPAYLRAQRSILCGSGAPVDPDPDVYHQIMQMIANGMLRGENGKTAYQYAQAGGYTGTESEFAAKLAKEIPDAYVLPIASAEVKGGVKVGHGLRMDGEVLGVAPEDAYELIETIVCDGTYSNISRTVRLKRVVLYINTKTAEAAASVAIEASNEKGLFGYLWIPNMVNTGERWAYAEAVSDGKGDAYIIGTTAVTNSYGSGGLSRTAPRLDGGTPIIRIGLYVSGGINFPAGSTIEIWGVRADA